jgi:rubrerythrin
LTVQADLEKAVAAAQSALGTYENFAVSTLDESAKQMFKQLSSDMEHHVDLLRGRLAYVSQNNPMNKPLS